MNAALLVKILEILPELETDIAAFITELKTNDGALAKVKAAIPAVETVLAEVKSL